MLINNGKKKKVLLCDSSFNVIKILEQLKKRGFHVSVCGSRQSDPCHALADESFVFDYSDKKLLLEIVKKNKIDFLLPGCTDISYLSSCWVANQLQLSGYDSLETTEIIHNKYKFRKFLLAEGHPSPKFTTDINLINKLKFPILIKPRSSFSGRGIQKINNRTELILFKKNFNKTRVDDEFIAEEFIKGQLYSISAFIRRGKIAKHFFVNEFCTIFPYQVNSSNLEVSLNDKIKKNIYSCVNLICKTLSLNDGLLHVQLISNNKSYYIIEAARRCPGDLYGELIQRSTKENYYDYYLRSFCGIKTLPKSNTIHKAFISRHTLSVKTDCTFISSSVLSSIKLPIINYQLKTVGQKLLAAPFDRAAIFFIEHKSLNSMERITKYLYKYIKVEFLKSD